MKKLFLSGGGDNKDSKDLDKKFVDSLPNKRFIYIPLAMEGNKKHPYDKCYEWIIGTFSSLTGNKVNITMLTDLSGIGIDYLKLFDAIYLGGGNTYKLLKDLRTTNFDAVLKKFVESYGPIYGGSAGAIILGKNIATVKEENTIGYQGSTGLNLIKGLSVICHFKQTAQEKKKINEFINKHKSGVIALPEETGLIISNEEAETVGSKPVHVFSKTRFHFKKINGNLVYEKIL